MTQKFCYWSVADNDHSKMMGALIHSARQVGVKEDFHVWSDVLIPGAINHDCGIFSKKNYIFKFKFLLDEVSKLDYEYFVFLDADNFFVRHPGENIYDKLLRDNKWFAQLENECNSKLVKRGDWWGCPIKWYSVLLKYFGVTSKKLYNTNAGFWIVRKDAILEFYQKTMEIFEFVKNELEILTVTEELPLAIVAHFVDDVDKNNFDSTSHVWASDWTGQFTDKLPTGKSWVFTDYMTGEQQKGINPAIVHVMRAKDALIKYYNEKVIINKKK